jgi:TRAP-type C4-dicarboxylate transport system substrate-binding protein
MFQAYGANPSPMKFSEVFTALQTGVMDGEENPFAQIYSAKFYEVQKYLAITNHQYNPQSVLISKKVWDSINAADKKIISDAATEAAKFQRQTARDQAGRALENLKKNGMQVTELSGAELAKFRDKIKPVIAKHSEAVGPDVVKALEAELAKARK